jgi:predicted phosphohydrolase
MLRIVCVSDTHARHDRSVVPAGDVLLHAGDLTEVGDLADVTEFDRWLGSLPHRHKVVICGNHDFCFQRQPAETRARIRNAVYLEDSGVQVGGLRVWGSPWQPWFYDWAFNLPRGPQLAAKWSLIPADTDVLLTHGPPLGFGDRTRRGEGVGCADLMERVRVVRPKLHVFGHIHEAAGVCGDGHTMYVNASTQSGEGAAVVIEWDGRAMRAVGQASALTAAPNSPG